MLERLQKIISSSGAASRRNAEEMILQGRVKVNGNIASIGEKADPIKDIIEIDGIRILTGAEPTYIVLNKPRGYVTTMNDEKGRKTVAQLVSDCGTRVYPVGRLDMNSEGLLIMTNDGDAAYKLMHPSYKHMKTYLVTVKGDASSLIEDLKAPIKIDGTEVIADSIGIISNNERNTVLLFTIHEGRNRQIRRMCSKVGLEVVKLVRISEGDIKLGQLKPGKWRMMTREEIEYINKIKDSDVK